MSEIEQKLEAIKEINNKKDKVEMAIHALSRFTHPNIDLSELDANYRKEVRDLTLRKYQDLRESLINEAGKIINEQSI